MANPQKEDGHIDIANEIVDAFARFRMSGNEWQVLWVILRKTYGWQKKSDRISLSQISKMTGISTGHVARTVAKLSSRQIITTTKTGTTLMTTYQFQKDYSQWKLLPKLVVPKQVLPKQDSATTKFGNRVLPKLVDTNNTITNNTITNNNKASKKRSHPISLQLWFDIYLKIKAVEYKVSNWGEDTKHAEWLLASCENDTTLLERLYKLYLTDSDKFIAKSGWSLRFLRQNFNGYFARAKGVVTPTANIQRIMGAMLPVGENE